MKLEEKLVLQTFWEKIKKYFATKLYVATLKSSKQDTLIAGKGIRIVNNVISNSLFPYKHKNEQGEWVIEGSDEKVIVTLFGPPGFNLENRQITLTYYLNNEPVLPARVITKTTDENGVAVFSSDPETGDGTGVPVGYEYEITFPKIANYLEITPEKHVAGVVERNIEVTYVGLPDISEDDYGEEIVIHLDKFENNTVTPFEGVSVSVKIGTATATTYTTDINGNTVSFKVRYGLSYTVTVPDTFTNYYVTNNGYVLNLTSNKRVQTYTSEKRYRNINFTYEYFNPGIFIVDKNGVEYTLEEWELARDVDLTVINSDAILFKFSTKALYTYDGVFYVDIDCIRKRTYSNKQWSNICTAFISIPLNGDDATVEYYYDGLGSSKLIKLEGEVRNILTPAVNYCLDQQIILLNQKTLQGFLGSLGLWTILWSNRTTIDNLLLVVRPTAEKPDGVTYYTLSSLTTYKWTSTLINWARAWVWYGNAKLNNDAYSRKIQSFPAIPFYI